MVWCHKVCTTVLTISFINVLIFYNCINSNNSTLQLCSTDDLNSILPNRAPFEDKLYSGTDLFN